MRKSMKNHCLRNKISKNAVTPKRKFHAVQVVKVTFLRKYFRHPQFMGSFE